MRVQIHDVEAGPDGAHDGDLILQLLDIRINRSVLLARKLGHAFHSELISRCPVHCSKQGRRVLIFSVLAQLPQMYLKEKIFSRNEHEVGV